MRCSCTQEPTRPMFRFELPEHEKEDIKDVAWRCPPVGQAFQTDTMPPLPAMNEVMAHSLKWDPTGSRWGRSAHWPLIIGVGNCRYRSPAAQKIIAQKRARKARAKEAAQGVSALVGDTRAWYERGQPSGKGGWSSATWVARSGNYTGASLSSRWEHTWTARYDS